MQGIKEEFDADRKENYVSITDFVTDRNNTSFPAESAERAERFSMPTRKHLKISTGLSNKV